MSANVEIRNLPKRGPGRPKGSINKLHQAAKDAIAAAANELGGHQRIVAWAKEDPKHESMFWSQIYPKLIPLRLDGEMTHKVSLVDTLKALKD